MVSEKQRKRRSSIRLAKSLVARTVHQNGLFAYRDSLEL